MPIFRIPDFSAMVSPIPPYIRGTARRTAAARNAVIKLKVKIC
jgi:hypothetical protein